MRHWETIGRKIPTGYVFEELLADNFVMTCAFCGRSDLFRQHVTLGEYVARGYLALDYAACLDLSRHTPFGYIDHSLARYRVLPNSACHSTNPARMLDLQQRYRQV